MSMCRVISCVVEKWCLLWPVYSLGRILLAFALLHFVLWGQISCYSKYLDFLLLPSSLLWWPIRPFRTTDKKDVLFSIGDWNAKVGSQEIPGVTGKFGLGVQNETGKKLTEFFQENALVRANTLFQQHRRRFYTWTSPDGQYWNQIDYILCSQRWRSSIQLAKRRWGADCGSDHECQIAKVRLQLKKLGKTLDYSGMT